MEVKFIQNSSRPIRSKYKPFSTSRPITETEELIRFLVSITVYGSLEGHYDLLEGVNLVVVQHGGVYVLVLQQLLHGVQGGPFFVLKVTR